MPKPCNCGKKKSVNAGEPDTYQSAASYGESDELVTIAARSYIVLRTNYGNYRLRAGNSMRLPQPIASDLITNINAPIWIVP